MALFNKLFISRKKNACNHEYVSEKRFGFSKEQVRVVLYRECDFRGRKLLFDSTAIKKIQIKSSMDGAPTSVNTDQSETYAEVTDGYGYMYIKPPTDTSHLAEMIFGLVAMSFRGSYFKIHNLETPPRLMFTQVFPSPKYIRKPKTSVSSHGGGRTSSQSLEHSIRLDDSGTSISDHISVHSTASDTLLVCRHNIPLDISHKLLESSSSVICDSGVYGEQSYSSCDGSRHFSTIPFWETSLVKGRAVSFSNSTLYKKWLRSSSLDQSISSSTGSMDETFNKQRSSKLGLAFIIHLTAGQEESQIQFFMEHIAIMESMLWRARQATEVAYLKPNHFLSILVKMVNLTSFWLTNLLSGPLLPLNLWTYLCNNYSVSDNSSDTFSNCDNNNSINMCNIKCQKRTPDILKSLFDSPSSGYFGSGNINGDSTKASHLLSGSDNGKTEFSFFNITKIIKDEWDSFNSKIFGTCDRNNVAEKFVQEFCELIDTIDVKDTNFFISTLLTAVLTHHLGWVATCLPPENGNQIVVDMNMPFNPLWEQLSDLYGAVGYPTKMAQTIVTGNKRKDLVVKIISCFTYFIRCCDLKRNHIMRSDIYNDNKTADYICEKNSCIPKENYKKYRDHLREMLNSNNVDTNKPKNEKNDLPETNFKKGLCRTEQSHDNLKKLEKIEDKSILRSSKLNGLIKNANCSNLSQLIDSETDSRVEQDFDMKNVTFVLGDDDELINIKKKDSEEETKKIGEEQTDALEKISMPNFFNLIFKKYETFEEEFSKSQFKDGDFEKDDTCSYIKPSISWSSLQQAEEEETLTTDIDNKFDVESHAACCAEKPFVRSKSEPPEAKKQEVEPEVKAKYRYSGVKFSLHQYPQVVTNYMRSKNLEMANLPFSEITKKFDQISLENEEVDLDFSQYDVNLEEMDALQTPSNASELEFTSDMPRHQNARESSERPVYLKTNNTPASTTTISGEKYCLKKCSFDETNELLLDVSKMKIIYFPMPKSEITPLKTESVPYSVSLIRGLNDSYIPDLVLQGTSAPKKDWESMLRNELSLSTQHCLLDQRLEEAVAIIADTDNWEVQLLSSHTYVIDKSSSGVKVGMSQLIASMLDSLLRMWKLKVPPQLCLMHIEQRLQAVCVRSKALAQLLLGTEFCSMEFLTSTLHLEVNDVPLLLAVASTYSPQVTQKYGISFQ